MTEQAGTLSTYEALTGRPLDNTNSIELRARQAEERRKAREVPWSDLYQAGVENNHIVTNLMQYHEMVTGFQWDDQWELDPDRLLKDLKEFGLPAHWASEFSDTLSEEHYLTKMRVLATRAANEQMLVNAGGKGFAAVLASAISDPIGAAVDAIAAPLAAGRRGGFLYRMGRAAMGAGGASAVVGGAQGLVNPDYDYKDVLIDFAAGAGMGILLEGGGTLLNAAERKEAFDSFNRWLHKENPTVFGRDTASAARVADSPDNRLVGNYTGVGQGRVKSASDMVEDLSDDVGMIESAVNKRLRVDAWRHVDDQGPEGRTLLRLLGSDPAGVKDKGDTVNMTGAIERANRIRGTLLQTWRAGSGTGKDGWEGALAEYLEAQGKNGLRNWWTRSFSIKTREDFSRQVGEYALTGVMPTDPAMVRAIRSLERTADEIWREGVKAGVKGMDASGALAGYTIPRTLRADLWQFMRDLNISDSRVIEEPITEMFERALANGRIQLGLEVNEEVTKKVAKAYATRVVQGGKDAMGGIDRITELRLDFLDEVLQEAGLPEVEIKNIVEQFFPDKSQKNAVPTDRLKQRLPLDMTVSTTLEDGTELRLLDFFDTHAERVMDNYIREMGGHIALAQTGFKSHREVEGLLDKLHGTSKELDANGYRIGKKALRNILGRPLVESEAEPYARAMRMIGDVNFLSTMGSVVFSMVAENGKILGMAGLRATMKQIPRMDTIIKQAINGTLDDEMARQMAAFWGIGNQTLRNQVSIRPDDYNLPGFSDGMLGKFDRFNQRAKKFQAVFSGLTPVTDIQQVFFGSAMLQNLTDAARGSGIHPALRGRLRDYGLTNKEINAVLKHLKENAVVKNGVLVDPKLDDMPEKLNIRFAEGMNRAVRHVIQDLDMQSLPEFMHAPFGRMIMQFRTFPVGAWVRHTLHGAAKADRIAVGGFLASMPFALAGYVGMVYINHANNPEMRKKMLEPENLAKMAFARTADASIIPMLFDTLAPFAGVDQQFTFGRTTGLGSDFVTGIPTVNTINRLGQIGQLPVNILHPGRQVTEEQLRASMSVVAANHLPGVLNLQHAVASQFPSAYELDQ